MTRSSTLTSILNLSFFLWIFSSLKPLEFFLNCTDTNHNNHVKMHTEYMQALNHYTDIVGTPLYLKTWHTTQHNTYFRCANEYVYYASLWCKSSAFNFCTTKCFGWGYSRKIDPIETIIAQHGSTFLLRLWSLQEHFNSIFEILFYEQDPRDVRLVMCTYTAYMTNVYISSLVCLHADCHTYVGETDANDSYT